MVKAMVSRADGTLNQGDAILLTDIVDLAATLASARAEIAAIGADDITASQIPSATDELDAIVEHTAAATDSILESCEQMETVMPRVAAAEQQVLQDCITRIYEACSFQDITGQRITKIVSLLQEIERKVARMIEVFPPGQLPPPRAAAPVDPAQELLNGPQLSANAMHQSDIDALLASFD